MSLIGKWRRGQLQNMVVRRTGASRVMDSKITTAPKNGPSKQQAMGFLSQNMKYISIVILIFQNTTLVLTLRYSRIVNDGDGHKYLASTAVALAEVLKILTCLTLVLREQGYSFIRTFELIKREVFIDLLGTLKLSVPAFLYTIQNNLLYLALSLLDAATYQVTYQLKILTTALFSVLMLRKKLVYTQWISLVILTAAVALVQLSSTDGSSDDATYVRFNSTMLEGLLVVVLACLTSGFSGVYFEKILKGSTTSLWIRNIQLGFFSLVFGLATVFAKDGAAVRQAGFFQGYSTVVVIVIMLQAMGGLTVAAVIKYADNIMKGFATAISIVVSSLSSYLLLNDFNPTALFLVGAGMVMVATVMYSLPASKQTPTSQTPAQPVNRV